VPSLLSLSICDPFFFHLCEVFKCLFVDVLSSFVSIWCHLHLFVIYFMSALWSFCVIFYQSEEVLHRSGVVYLRIENAEGYVLIAVYLLINLLIYLYACYSRNKNIFNRIA